MTGLTYLKAALLAATLCIPVHASAQDANGFQTGMIPPEHIMLPDGDVSANIFLLSGQAGWGETEQAQADALVENGAAVVGIDLPKYLAALKANEDECIYMISDIEELAQEIQRKANVSNYRPPIIAGTGEGGALALAMIAQSPAATIGEAVAVDPLASIPLGEKILCTPATKEPDNGRTIYGLTDGPLPAPVSVVFTGKADAKGRTHVENLVKSHSDIDVKNVDGDAQAALGQALQDRIDAAGNADNPLGLPLTVLEAKPTMDTMAIIYSGDGGWRDLDKDIGSFLQQDGVPTIGVDSLRYFWSEKKPEEIASDMKRIIDTYRKEWKVKNVMLIGYSFGADVLPVTYNLLPEKDKSRIVQMSLLSLSHEVSYEISVGGWLGVSGSGEQDPVTDLAKIDPKIVQCVYGTDDEDAACPALKDKGAEVIGIDGGHHFDEDYEALTKRIVAALKKRLGQ
ncbi:virulence factor family protein [Rhizobium skierniewicense]|uniref:AcvB/VirJ family lysyl-phosphatidylglycerol hydrolase n=1 Tax=Rhizobium skierniewicense TaxID=984260 RepID=UPI001FAD6937|nr:AcvB/VirJ family lysyl-phosphatidylglycerol hydrolase [Rhizobium skierniewicense]MCI9867013.1 virulence factor family protein [Rhizobium skierniewicense]